MKREYELEYVTQKKQQLSILMMVITSKTSRGTCMKKITLPAEKVKKSRGTPRALLFLLAEDGHLSVVRVRSFDKQKKSRAKPNCSLRR